ncbi:PAX-interacting protein 1-like [Helianthus annuus]|uniref:PAX-interacting protein 1-like n=1 Tax=Helianthus annuus TaxID=4232 RepID=UPI001652CE68|nr:PAX-interacting protein 1-like [Helianthus annuus]
MQTQRMDKLILRLHADWLQSCGEACRNIDEKSFILRDPKKEKEFGFSLPTSLAHARQNPLLKGHRVLITPNTKPGKDILSYLVKAVHGVAIQRMGRSLWNNDKVPEGLLILSCEEDYAVCLPFLEEGSNRFRDLERNVGRSLSEKITFNGFFRYSGRISSKRLPPEEDYIVLGILLQSYR